MKDIAPDYDSCGVTISAGLDSIFRMADVVAGTISTSIAGRSAWRKYQDLITASVSVTVIVPECVMLLEYFTTGTAIVNLCSTLNLPFL